MFCESDALSLTMFKTEEHAWETSPVCGRQFMPVLSPYNADERLNVSRSCLDRSADLGRWNSVFTMVGVWWCVDVHRILGMIHNVNAGDNDGITALMLAARIGHLDIVISLMEAKQCSA